MITAPFQYAAPDTLEGALGALREGGEDAKLLAGGHSLVPLMKLRLAAPSMLVDLRRVPGLRGIRRDGDSIVIGALTTHAEIARAPELGLLASVAATIADPQVRNMGTIGGSLAHGDPASDLPGALLALEGSVHAVGPDGERSIPALEMFRDYMETALDPGEILTEVRVPALDGYGHGYQKFNRRSEDWAMVAVSALVRRSGEGRCEDVRVSLANMASTPLRAGAVEDALRGQTLSRESIDVAAAHAGDGTDPPADLNASAEYKRHLASVLAGRALRAAAGIV